MLEPFFTTKPHGNGLGLSICRSVLWEVDGTLTIQSEPGNGTRVHVGVPQAVAPQPHATVIMKPARILVVDDEPGMLRAVERVLSGTHHVIGTRSSRDALVASPPSSIRSWRLSISGCPIWTASS